MSRYRFTLIRTARHKQFEYRPRFYDPIQEERESRRNSDQHGVSDPSHPEDVKKRVQLAFARARKQAGMQKLSGAGSSFFSAGIRWRIVFILAVLLFLAWWIIQETSTYP